MWRFQWSWLSQGEYQWTAPRHLLVLASLLQPASASGHGRQSHWKNISLSSFPRQRIAVSWSLRDLSQGSDEDIWTGNQIRNRVHRKRDVWSWGSKASNTEKSRFGGVGKMVRKKNSNPTFNRRVRIGWDAKISLGLPLRWAKENDPEKELLNVANMIRPLGNMEAPLPLPTMDCMSFWTSLFLAHTHTVGIMCVLELTACNFYTRKCGKAILPREKKKKKTWAV